MNDLDDSFLLSRLQQLHQKILDVNEFTDDDFQQKRRNLRLRIDNVICHYHRFNDAISFVFKQDVSRGSLNIRPLFGFEPDDPLLPIPAEKKKMILQKVQKNCFKKHPIYFDRITEKELHAKRFCYNVPVVNGSRVYIVGDYSLSVRELTYLMTWEDDEPKFKVEIKATSDEQVNFGATQGNYSFLTISLNLHIEQNESTTFYPNIRYCLQQFDQVCSSTSPLPDNTVLPYLKPFLDP